MRISDLCHSRMLHLLSLLLTTFLAFGCTSPPPAASTISSAELTEMLQTETPRLILDVRTREEFAQGHVPGAVNIPHAELESRLSEVDVAPSTPVIVYCQSGGRARQAESILMEAGFSNVLDLSGHMGEWKTKQLPVEK